MSGSLLRKAVRSAASRVDKQAGKVAATPPEVNDAVRSASSQVASQVDRILWPERELEVKRSAAAAAVQRAGERLAEQTDG